MNELHRSFHQAVRDLDRMGHPTAVVGGLAVSARTEARFTRDIDLAVAVSGDVEAETLVRQLIASGYGVVAMIEQDTTGRFATARLVTPGGDPDSVVVDLLFASSGIEPEIVAQATELEIWPVRIGRCDQCDQIDLILGAPSRIPRQELEREQDELALAFAAARLIEERGFARDRQLAEDLRHLLADLSE